MADYTYINIENWNRRAQYEFFKNFDSPFFNITTAVELENLWTYAHRNRLSFFLANLFCATKAANQLPSFRYRMRGEQVICYDVIHAGSTVLYEDHTFGFCYFDYQDDLFAFCEEGEQRLAAQKQKKGFDPKSERDDLLHFSSIPWVTFTGVQHARRFGREDAIPKITFGKYAESDGVLRMPMSIEVHHALLDGYHVGQYIEKYQSLLRAFGT